MNDYHKTTPLRHAPKEGLRIVRELKAELEAEVAEQKEKEKRRARCVHPLTPDKEIAPAEGEA